MADATTYPLTRQGVRDLDQPSRSNGNAVVNVGPNERSLSTVGGAVLAGFGLTHANGWGLLLAAVGGSLIYRGVTGHCTAYAAAGINTAR